VFLAHVPVIVGLVAVKTVDPCSDAAYHTGECLTGLAWMLIASLLSIGWAIRCPVPSIERSG
jgi:hypothetical protein